MPGVIQRLLAGLGLLVLGPFILGLAVLVRLTSPGPAFHRATRVRPGGTFTLYKLRSLGAGAAGAGPGITRSGDPRVTRLGRILRRTKLDELPQLWNVVRGDMLLVGPRPEDPRFVELDDPLHALVFSATPGITGPTALAFRNEEEILAIAARAVAHAVGRVVATPEDLDHAYRQTVLPAKLRMDAHYLATRTLRGDVGVLLQTAGGRAAVEGDLVERSAMTYFVEWGGRPWEDMVWRGIQALGDIRDRRILEIGARSGRMATLFATMGATVVGIDIVAGFETAAAAEAAASGVASRVEFRLDDGRLSSVAGETFDVVFTKSVLVVIPDRDGYLAAVRDVLRPGGLLVSIENGQGGLLARFLRRVRRVSWDYRQIDYFDRRAVDQVATVLPLVMVKTHRMPPIWLIIARRSSGDSVRR